MKKLFSALLSVVFISLLLPLTTCSKEESTATKIKAYAEAMNLVKPAYKMIKDHHAKPELAGTMFSGYMKAHRDPLIAAYKNYYKHYGDGKNLSEAEKNFLQKENNEVTQILNSPEVQKLMADEIFKKSSKEGFEALKDAQAVAKK